MAATQKIRQIQIVHPKFFYAPGCLETKKIGWTHIPESACLSTLGPGVNVIDKRTVQ